MSSNILTLGFVGTPHGLKGYNRLRSLTEKPDDIMSYENLLIKTNGQWLQSKIEDYKMLGSNLLVKIKDSNCRNSASNFTNCALGIEKKELKELNLDEYYWIDLIDCRVFDSNGYDLGLVVNLMNAGANDNLIVKANQNDAFNKKERLIPFINDFIIDLDIDNKKIILDWSPDF